MTGISVLKKNIRDTERLLRRPTLAADIRRDSERKLAALRHAATQQAATARVRSLHQRYKMVRFVESKKAGRRLKQAMNSGDEELIEEAKKDCLYVQFYPEDAKYLSLYAEAMESGECAKRDEMRAKIFEEHCNERIVVPGLNMAAAAAGQSGPSKQADEEPFDEFAVYEPSVEDSSCSEKLGEYDLSNQESEHDDSSSFDEDSSEDSDLLSEDSADTSSDEESVVTNTSDMEDDGEVDEDFDSDDSNDDEDDDGSEESSESDVPTTKKQRR